MADSREDDLATPDFTAIMRDHILKCVRRQMRMSNFYNNTKNIVAERDTKELLNVFALTPSQTPSNVGFCALEPRYSHHTVFDSNSRGYSGEKRAPTLLAKPARARSVAELAARLYTYMPWLHNIVDGAVLQRADDGTPVRGAVLVGGLPSAALMTDAPLFTLTSGAPDADFMLINVSADEARAFVRCTKDVLVGFYGDNIVTHVNSIFVTYVCGRGSADERRVQIITGVHRSLQEVLARFDLGPSMFAFDGARAWTLRGVGALAWTHRLLVAHSGVMRGTYWGRVAKYARRGYTVVVPQLKDFPEYYAAGKIIERTVRVSVCESLSTASYESYGPGGVRRVQIPVDGVRGPVSFGVREHARKSVLNAILVHSGSWGELVVPGAHDPESITLENAFTGTSAAPLSDEERAALVRRGYAAAAYACRPCDGNVNVRKLVQLCEGNTNALGVLAAYLANTPVLGDYPVNNAAALKIIDAIAELPVIRDLAKQFCARRHSPIIRYDSIVTMGLQHRSFHPQHVFPEDWPVDQVDIGVSEYYVPAGDANVPSRYVFDTANTYDVV